MIRFLFRLLALAALALAVIIAVMDATRSVASSAVEMTALGYLWLCSRTAWGCCGISA